MCNAFKELEAEWMERGKTEGIEQEKQQSIISMLEFGITKEQILTRYSKEDLEKIEHIISAYNLPIRLKTAKMSADDVLAATKSDKKMEDGRVKFVLLHAIGDAYISREVSDEMLSDGIRYVLQ